MTLRFRLIAGYSALVSLTIIALLASVRLLVEHTALRQVDVHHAVEAQEFVELGQEAGPDSREARWRRHMELDSGFCKFSLHTAAGRLVYRSDALKEVAVPYLSAVPDGRVDIGGGLGECRITSHPIDGYTLRIITPLNMPLAVLTGFYEIGAIILLLGIAVSLVCGALFARWVLRPLVRMEDAARRIGPGDPGARIPEEIAGSGDELGRLAGLLNAGYDRIAASVERLRAFSAEVSHELRTPLSIVRLNAERIRDTPGVPEPVRLLATEQLAEIERLKRFIANLLGYAKLDAGSVRMAIAPVALADWLNDFAEDASLLAEDAGCRFELLSVGGSSASFDKVWIRQLLFNLLSNALRISPPGGLIRMGAAFTPGVLMLWMDDEGPGLPPERLDLIFRRYVRFGEELGPAEGVGLGLAICRTVVELHGGSIHAENRTDRSGLRVELSLPQTYASIP